MATTTGFIDYTEQAAPANPAASHQRLFVRSSDHVLCYVNSSGTVTPVASSGAATGSGLTMSTARLLGRTTASTGAIEEITVGSGLSLSAGALTATGGASGALIFREAHTGNNTGTTLDFTTFVNASYDVYQIEIDALAPASNAVDLQLIFGYGGTPTYDTGANYNYANLGYTSGGGTSNDAAGGATLIKLAASVSNNAGYGTVNASLRLWNTASSSQRRHIAGTSVFANSSPAQVYLTGGGTWEDVTHAVTALRFKFASGNILSGSVRIYGISNT
jgi:hypothetical protein